jgi:hypothetical protein
MSDERDQQPGAPTTTMARVHSQTTALGPPQAIYPTSFEGTKKLAEELSASDLLPKRLQGSVSNVFMTILTGLDLGISPASALRNIHVVEGKPYLSSQLKVALCVARRDVCRYFRLVESTAERATWETWRVDRKEPEKYTFTIDQARRAGLLDRGDDPKKNNWNRFPENMLRARAASVLVDTVYQDVVTGVQTTEEGQDEGVLAMAEVSPGVFAPTGVSTMAPAPPPPAPPPPLPKEPTGPASPNAREVTPVTDFERFAIAIEESQTQRELDALAGKIQDAVRRRVITDQQATDLRTSWDARRQLLASGGRA